MAKSHSPSKAGALITLTLTIVVIGGLAWTAFHLSRSLNTSPSSDNQAVHKPQSPDLQNIHGQFDDL